MSVTGIVDKSYKDSEIIIGLVCPVGTNKQKVIDTFKEKLTNLKYKIVHIKVSDEIIRPLISEPLETNSEYQRILEYINGGNNARKATNDNSILAKGIASQINLLRMKAFKGELSPNQPRGRVAYIIDSLKHPEEVFKLREIYPAGFYLFAINEDESRRRTYLEDVKKINKQDIDDLILKDMDEKENYGQHTRDTFEVSDFFISIDKDGDKIRNDIYRILEIMFGHPYHTPTFDEYAMFMAFSSGLRSADLARQVGAVITIEDKHEVLSTGANDVPKYGGGQYWPYFNEKHSKTEDYKDGRDYTREIDPNKDEQEKIVDDILNALKLDPTEDLKEYVEVKKILLKNTKIKDLTEYGRIVHAEMEAILMCSRNGISTRDTTLYCSTFPCHNCAKHIISAGIKKVVYIEPYPKSKTLQFYSDSVSTDLNTDNRVQFVPFVGIAPRKFYDLFSLTQSSGDIKIRRDNTTNKILKWEDKNANLRCRMQLSSYLEKEIEETSNFANAIKSSLEKVGE